MSQPFIAQMSVEELIRLNPALATLLAQKEQVIKHRDLKIAQLTHEMATLKRWTFGKRSEQVTGLQRSLLEESIEEGLEAIAIELEELKSTAPERPKGIPSAPRCRRICRGSRSAMSRTRRSVAAAARSNASART